MKSKLILLFSLFALFATVTVQAAPLRVFIRAGVKTHGPDQHDHPRFLAEWTKLLNEQGAKADGAMDFPTAAQLENTDVLVLFAADAGTISTEQRAYLTKFLQRGGGIVAIHDAVVGNDPDWFKTVIGGAWQNGKAKWLEGPESFYYMDKHHAITEGASNFQLKDEIYYELNMMPEVHILAAAYTPNTPNTPKGEKNRIGNKPSVYDVQPQMWTYEKDNHRAFVSIPGHNYATFNLPNYRAVLLRGIAWAGKRANVDELCSQADLASLRYPEGGPTAPEQAAAKLELHPDFNISLVAAEPLINKAINMDWDPQGRLWVAETPEYPNGRREARPELKNTDSIWKDSGSLMPGKFDRPATDRISILSDPDENGRFRKKTIFFEGLELVTSFVFYKDGVIVSQAPDILFLRDTDGDGKADKVEKLYTGLGIGDTHAVINNLRWGFDGWIYATHGYSTGDVTSPDGSKHFGRDGSGVVRFRPDGSAFEQVSSKGGNTWGLDFGWDGEIFYTQPTSNDLLNHVVLPENALARGKVSGVTSFKPIIHARKSFPLMSYEQQAYVQIDLVGYFTAAAGCAIYDGGAWPKEWNYNYFTTEPTINIVHHEVVEPLGVSYDAHKTREPEFIGGKDMWFRPIETRIGPDGALYILDFYNQAVVHNDTRGTIHGPANAALRPDRDHYFGRIWRVQHKQAVKLEIPNLAKASAAELVKALEHPNMHVRMNAQRLLSQGDYANAAPALMTLVTAKNVPAYARVHALWTLYHIGKLGQDELVAAVSDADPAIRKNAAHIAQLPPTTIRGPEHKLQQALLERIDDPDARVRLEALVALGSFEITPATAKALVSVYPDLKDPWLESALIGTAANAPVNIIDAAMDVSQVEALKPLVAQMALNVAAKQNGADAAALVEAMAKKPATADLLKQSVLQIIAQNLKPENAPAWTDELQAAFQKLLASSDATVPAAALPLAGRWDVGHKLAAETGKLLQQLIGKLADTSLSDEQRGQVTISLLGVRQMNADILPAVSKVLTTPGSTGLKQRVVEALGSTGDRAVGTQLIAAFPALSADLQMSVFNQLLKRVDWSLALLEALKAGKVNPALLGPANLYRLRTHPDSNVAKAANQLIDELRGPEAKQKDELIAKFLPVITQPGNAAKGKELFTQNCATCHKLDKLGNEVGPVLTGMGAHGPAGLIVSVLDPNREVDPSFIAYNIETKDGESYDGIIVRENKASVVLKNATGEKELQRTEIKSLRNTGRSLMPEGFEALGPEALRDLLAFVCASEGRFRFLDLTTAFTADSRRGIYQAEDNVRDTLKFRKFGPASVDGVPFNIVDASKSTSGKNLVVLKGGPNTSFSGKLPQQVECKVGFAAVKLDFLGGVAGWGHPINQDGMPVMKVTVVYADGQKEELVMKNGEEFADYIRVVDVPGSKLTEGVVTENQLRWYSKSLKGRGVIDKLVLESFGNGVAPTTVAITAELTEATGAPTAALSPNTATDATTAPRRTFTWGKGIHVLLVGGGSSHDFNRFFNLADTATLQDGGLASVNYTDKPAEVPDALKEVDVLVISTNQKDFNTPAVRQAVVDFANAGKGLILLHPGLWYNYNDWPEYNRDLAGGGAHSHDKLGEFEVKVTNPGSPIMKGIGASFKITDELYHSTPDEKGTPIEVLCTATSPLTGKTFPSTWVVKYPKGKIVCISLGHDARAHDLPEYKAMLRNAVTWAAGK